MIPSGIKIDYLLKSLRLRLWSINSSNSIKSLHDSWCLTVCLQMLYLILAARPKVVDTSQIQNVFDIPSKFPLFIHKRKSLSLKVYSKSRYKHIGHFLLCFDRQRWLNIYSTLDELFIRNALYKCQLGISKYHRNIFKSYKQLFFSCRNRLINIYNVMNNKIRFKLLNFLYNTKKMIYLVDINKKKKRNRLALTRCERQEKKIMVSCSHGQYPRQLQTSTVDCVKKATRPK